MSFAVLVADELERFTDYARERGWDGLRLVSAGDSTIQRDLGFEGEDGAQRPGVSVFERRAGGGVDHFYSLCAFGPDGGRMMDLFSPVWHFLDLLPQGRGDWMPRSEG